VPRKVHYLATAALFRNRLVARFLLACGAIPVYRKQDEPSAILKPPSTGSVLAAPATTAVRNASTFDACYPAFGHGRLGATYREGTARAEARVRRIKTGAARLGLGYEAERPGALRVIPVGLNFDARKSFGGRVLVSFGPAVSVTPSLEAYRRDPVKAVEALTDAIQWGIEAEVVHVERIDESRLVN